MAKHIRRHGGTISGLFMWQNVKYFTYISGLQWKKLSVPVHLQCPHTGPVVYGRYAFHSVKDIPQHSPTVLVSIANNHDGLIFF